MTISVLSHFTFTGLFHKVSDVQAELKLLLLKKGELGSRIGKYILGLKLQNGDTNGNSYFGL